jgi:methionine-rich copper-binding protein CopC
MKISKKGLSIFIIFCMVLSLAISYALFNSLGDRNVSILSFGNSTPSKMSCSFLYFNGTEKKEIHLNAGEEATISFYSKISKGQLIITLLDNNGKVVKQFDNDVDQTETIKATIAESYQISVIAQKARGKYDISWHK